MPQLDSVRGIAALIVVFHHYLLVTPPTTPGNASVISHLFRLPLGWFSNGRAAVILFFVLSGFSLHRMLATPKPIPFIRYLQRRTCRIYMPYLAALALAILCNMTFSRGPLPEASAWFNKTWPWPISRSDVFQSILFIGIYRYDVFNTAFWSLAQEMRISIIFPFFFAATTHRKAVTQVVVTVATLVAGAAVAGCFQGNTGAISVTLLYAGVFLLGLLLSEHAAALTRLFNGQTRTIRMLFLGLSTGLLFNSYTAVHQIFKSDVDAYWEVWSAVGAFGCLLVALASEKASTILLLPPLRWLGGVSYSLYLVHGSVLFALVRIMLPAKGLSAVLAPYLVASLLLAQIFNVAVEKPCITLSRRFSTP